MVLHESILTKNPCYKAGRKITPTGIMLHSVRCPQPSAKVFVHNWDRETCDNKCVHAFVDANTGDVYQTLPWNHRGLHAGKHPKTKMTANNTHIGISMCEPPQLKYKKGDVFEVSGDKSVAVAAVKRTYESAVELCAQLCHDLGLPVDSIISQGEGYDNGIASAHRNPEHLWMGLGMGYSMDKFRDDVMIKLNRLSTAVTEPTTVEAAPVAVAEPTPMTVTAEPAPDPEPEPEPEPPKEFMVRVNVENLRIRSEPCVGNNTTGKYTGVGVFAIVEVQNGTGSKAGWGKLRDGSGWISLDYVERV